MPGLPPSNPKTNPPQHPGGPVPKATNDQLDPMRPWPGLQRILAPNPSPMTHAGTNTYILGQQAVAVIDPGPDHPGHLAAILAAVPAGGRITHILVTHAHLDHSALAPELSNRTGAPVLAYGAAHAGRSARMRELAATGLLGGGEGIDTGFKPDITLTDGEAVQGPDWHLTALHTPGHMASHLCFAMAGAVFTGDHVMGWASSLISPPDGDLAAFRAALARLGAYLASHPVRAFFPGHGPPVSDPAARLAFLSSHRQQRENEVLAALSERFESLAVLTERVYRDTSPVLHPAAARNLLAHLIDLTDRNLVTPDRPLSPASRFRRADPADTAP